MFTGFEIGFCSIVESGLELLIPLLLPAQCWVYKYVPPCLFVGISYFTEEY